MSPISISRIVANFSFDEYWSATCKSGVAEVKASSMKVRLFFPAGESEQVVGGKKGEGRSVANEESVSHEENLPLSIKRNCSCGSGATGK
jgi:hypothetical protein